MLKERARAVALALLCVDLLAVTVAFLAAYWIRDVGVPAIGIRPLPLYPLAQYLPLLPLLLGIWAFLLSRLGTYRSHRTITLLDEAWSILRVAAMSSLVLVLCIYLFRLDERLLGGDEISRLWVLLVGVCSAASVLVGRTTVRVLSRSIRASGYNYRTIVIVGTGESAQTLARSLELHGYWGYRLLGFVTFGERPSDPSLGSEVLGSTEELLDLVEQQVIDEVVFTVGRTELNQLEDLVLRLEEQGIVVRLALDLFPHARARVSVGDLDGVPMLTFSTVPSGVVRLAAKRMLDLALAFSLLVAALPAMIAICVAIKVTSPGSVLFRQVRCGLNGRRFTIYKFRTMFEGAEQRRRELEHLNEMDGPVFKVRRDPRVTRVGRLLRRYSLDELPQLWNVVLGDMSLVGPRPAIPEEVAQYESWQRRRLSMRPGITCLWQVSGRNEIDFERWIELDLEYIDSWSPLLDLKILARTVPVVLSGRGAS